MKSLFLLPLAAVFPALPAFAQVFSEPLAVKVGWDSQALFLGDIDGDGHEDMAIINNARARIVIRYGLKPGEKADTGEVAVQKDQWDPMLENAPYQKRWVTTGVTAYDLHFADLNGDGKSDMLYTSDRDELVVHLQKAERNWAAPQATKVRSLKNNWTTLATADLDADGDEDLAVLGMESIAIFENEKGGFKKPVYHPCGQSTYNLQLQDLNGDGKPDLTYQDPDAREVFVRLQRDGGFPVEQVLGVNAPGTMVRYDGQAVVSLSNETDALERLELKTAPTDLTQEEPAMLSYALGETKAEALHHVRVDFDSDGDLDLIVADENSAELRTYVMQGDGRFAAPVISSTVNGIKALTVSDLKPGGFLECVVFSETENIVGVSTMTADGSVPFPTQISLEQDPTTVTSAVFQEGQPACLAVTSEDHLHLVTWVDESWQTTSTEIKGVGKDRAMETRPFDINQDGRLDLLVLRQRKAMKMLLQQGDGSFQEAEEQSGFAEKLTDRLAPRAISSADVNGDGKDELLICRETFARALHLGSDGQLQVLSQINLKKKKISLRGATVAQVLGDEALEYLFYDHIFLYGEGQILRLPLDQKLLQAKQVFDYHTTLKDVEYVSFRIGDLNADGKSDAVVVDSTGSHVLEVLLGTDQGWESQQHFILFEADRHYRGKRGGEFQPRDFHLSDVNGDSKVDLVLHIHDRVLTYLQQ